MGSVQCRRARPRPPLRSRQVEGAVTPINDMVCKCRQKSTNRVPFALTQRFAFNLAGDHQQQCMHNQKCPGCISRRRLGPRPGCQREKFIWRTNVAQLRRQPCSGVGHSVERCAIGVGDAKIGRGEQRVQFNAVLAKQFGCALFTVENYDCIGHAPPRPIDLGDGLKD